LILEKAGQREKNTWRLSVGAIEILRAEIV
jgi:hypothetical protein